MNTKQENAGDREFESTVANIRLIATKAQEVADVMSDIAQFMVDNKIDTLETSIKTANVRAEQLKASVRRLTSTWETRESKIREMAAKYERSSSRKKKN